jgi:hypothetical protein
MSWTRTNADSGNALVVEAQWGICIHIVLRMLCIALIWTAAVYGMLPLKITEEILHCEWYY